MKKLIIIGALAASAAMASPVEKAISEIKAGHAKLVETEQLTAGGQFYTCEVAKKYGSKNSILGKAWMSEYGLKYKGPAPEVVYTHNKYEDFQWSFACGKDMLVTDAESWEVKEQSGYLMSVEHVTVYRVDSKDGAFTWIRTNESYLVDTEVRPPKY